MYPPTDHLYRIFSDKLLLQKLINSNKLKTVTAKVNY